jgi:flagellar capping protein FliD
MSTTAVSSSSSTPTTSSTSSTSSTAASTSATPTSTSFNAQQANQAAGQSIISALGAGSGVNVNALAQNLVNAEEIPQKNDINAKIQKNDTTISGLSGVMYIMQSFQTSLTTLEDKSNFNTLQVANTNTNALSVTTDNTASPGSHSIQINSLAQAQETVSTGFASNTSQINGGTAFSINIAGNNGVSTYTGQSQTGSATLSNVNFGTEPAVNDFKNFSVTVSGQTLSLTPAPATASLTDLASNLQSQLQSIQGSSDLTVTASPQSVTLAGVSFGTPPTNQDFTGLTVSIGGVTKTITPSVATTNMSDLANNLQGLLQSAYGTTAISVTLNGSNNLVISSALAPVTAANLTASASTAPVGSTASGNSTSLTLSGLSFDPNAPTTTDFSSLTVTIAGVTKSITPNLTSTRLADMASAVQAQLQTAFGQQLGANIAVTTNGTNNLVINSGSTSLVTAATLTPSRAVPVVGVPTLSANNLTVSSASGKVISNVTLSPSTSIMVGTPAGVSLGSSNTGTLTGVSFGSPAATTDFSSMTVEIGGVTQTITPNLTSTSLTDMATAVQAQLRTAFGATVGPTISVKVNGNNNLVISSTNSTVNYVTLTPKSGTTASGGSFNNNSISGLSFGAPPSTSDFQSFGIMIGGNPMTIYPNPSSPDLASLAANIQSQLNQQDASQFNGTGSDISVSVDSQNVMHFSSNSGRNIADPQFLEFAATPDGISQAINSKKLGITSTVINTGSVSNPYQILLTGNVGAANAFTVSASTDSGSSKLFPSSNIQSAQDAQLVVDGIGYTRTTNSITDILTGTTLSLNAVTASNTPATINMTRDTSALVTNINAMVSAYNDAFSVLNAVSDSKSTLPTYGGSLVGDSTVMMLKQKLRDLMLGQSSTPGSTVGALWQMGITVDDKGVMSVNSNVLTSTLNDNFNDVVKTFTGNLDNSLALTSSTAAGGLAGDAVKQLTSLLSATGPITTRSNDLTTQNQTYENDLSTLQVRMDALLAQYQTQFAAMDTLVGQINSERTSLTATFNGMMAMYTNK